MQPFYNFTIQFLTKVYSVAFLDIMMICVVYVIHYSIKFDFGIQEVQYILDSVVDALQDNPQRRFIYVEVAFFYRWWRQQHDSVRHVIKGLVNDGNCGYISNFPKQFWLNASLFLLRGPMSEVFLSDQP